MLEVGLMGPGQAALGYAGDTFNTAVYLRRLGRSTAYATALGQDDPFSRGVLQLMQAEDVDASLVLQVEGRLPGVYAIERDPAGERRFYYWRGESPAREYFARADRAALERAVSEAKLVYLSGVTLAIIGAAGRQVLGELLALAKSRGVAVGFDPNHRPQLWTDPAEARAAVDQIAPYLTYVSAGVSDFESLYGAEEGQARAAAWSAAGVEVLLRGESHSVTVCRNQDVLKLRPEAPVRALDTTGAGDAFNAGYLAARLGGREPRDAVHAARRLANMVVQHIGAIIPRTAMPPSQKPL
jgi:2-dehydro-3-deoxygluconokinase